MASGTKKTIFFLLGRFLSTLLLYAVFLGVSKPMLGAQVGPERATTISARRPVVGAERFSQYVPLLQNKRVGLVLHASSRVKDVLLVDTLIALGIDVRRLFSPEHGFGSTEDAGAAINDQQYRGIRLRSLYGKYKKPPAQDLNDLDVIVFDLQDVGARFYTYASTLHYVMQAAAEAHIQLIVLDRPNPNGHYIDGPLLVESERSFVGLHPLPIVHGLTLGELARMINGEGWLGKGLLCNLLVIPLSHWTHQQPYELARSPSPNLRSAQAIALYPSLCLFEGTVVGVGRGTAFPFEVMGYPSKALGSFCFTPRSQPGALKPRYMNERCCGRSFQQFAVPAQLMLEPLLDAYARLGDKKNFFSSYFDKLAGTKKLREQIQRGWRAKQIRASWQKDLRNYCTLRKPYLLYPDNACKDHNNPSYGN